MNTWKFVLEPTCQLGTALSWTNHKLISCGITPLPCPKDLAKVERTRGRCHGISKVISNHMVQVLQSCDCISANNKSF